MQHGSELRQHAANSSRKPTFSMWQCTAQSPVIIMYKHVYLCTFMYMYTCVCMRMCTRTCTRYLELAPKTTTWYLTGTTLARAGRHMQLTAFITLAAYSAFAVVAQQWFGVWLDEFADFGTSLISLVRTSCAAGAAGSYHLPPASSYLPPPPAAHHCPLFNVPLPRHLTPHYD